MRKHLLMAGAALTLSTAAFAQTRYLDPVFTDVTKTTGVQYGENYHFFILHDSPIPPTTPSPWTPTIGPMTLDLYKPTGDAETNRPLVILIHTGNFLPKYVNGSATGDKNDSVVVELANRFTKLGFVTAAPRYRLGWNPGAGTLIERTQQLLNAVYRSIHDIQTCVRYFKSRATIEGINPHKIILVGIGSGGYVANAYVTLDKVSETELGKFQDINGNSVINPALVGDINGVGGQFNVVNYPGIDKSVAMAVNLGGAMGDISWLEGGEVPIVGFHCRDDEFAPYDSGTVIVPTTQQPVVFVHGTRTVIKKSVALGNNDVLLNHTFSDAFSARAYALNPKAQFEGLFEFRRPITPGPFEEGSPWDWWDSTTVVTQAAQLGANGQNIHASGLATNPDMSSQKARRYIDTIMGFSAPRIYQAVITQPLSLDEQAAINSDVKLFPNPVSSNFSIAVNNSSLNSVTVVDMNGKTVQTWNNLNSQNVTLERGEIAAGLYLVKVKTSKGEIARQVIFK